MTIVFIAMFSVLVAVHTAYCAVSDLHYITLLSDYRLLTEILNASMPVSHYDYFSLSILLPVSLHGKSFVDEIIA